MIAVIDTNIFMAALLNPSGAPAKMRQRWRKEQFETLNIFRTNRMAMCASSM
jgi:predicted nucleic acid-binding protein